MGGTLLVASPGGHVDELRVLAARLDLPKPCRWVTSDSAQTRGLLAAEALPWVRPIGPRSLRPVLASLPDAHRIMREYRPELVLSTGAALAVPYLLAARAHRVRVEFVDSATRFDGPSLTGRIAERLPGTTCLGQDPGWSRQRRRWRHLGSVFDAFTATTPDEGGRDGTAEHGNGSAAARPGVEGAIHKVVVSLGGEKFGFPRAVTAVRRVLDALPTPVEVTWQLGATDPFVAGSGDTVHDRLDPMVLRGHIADADLVIAHAGVGSVLSVLEAGRVCLVLPRSGRHGEHVDDHQWQLAERLAVAGLVVAADPDDLTVEHLRRAAAGRVQAAKTVAWQLG